VHRPLGEQQQDGRADVAAPAASAATPAASDVRPEAGSETWTRSEVGTEAMPGSAPVGVSLEVRSTVTASAWVAVIFVEVLHCEPPQAFVSYIVDDISAIHPTQGVRENIPFGAHTTDPL